MICYDGHSYLWITEDFAIRLDHGRWIMSDGSRHYDLTQGTAWRVMLYFAMPIFLGTLFQSFYTTADAVIIGRFAGKSSLAAIESVYTLTKLPVNFFMGLASGATIILSQYFGAKKLKEVSDASHTVILFALVGGLLLSIIGCVLSPLFIRWTNVPEEILRDAQIYILIYFGGLSVSMIYNVGAGILRALGNSKTPFYFLIVANLLNVVLDLFFIVVLEWGVAGAATATVLSKASCAILVMRELFRTTLPCRIDRHKIRAHPVHLKEIFRLGLPIGIQFTLYPIANTIVQSKTNTFGVNSIAAWAVCGKLDFLIWTVTDAFNVAVSTFVAQNYGALQFRRAKKGVLVGLAMCSAAILTVSAILYFGSVPLARLLVEDEAVIEIVHGIMLFLAPLYIIFVFCEIFPAAIRGTGETLKPMIITLLCTCLFRVLWIWFVVPIRPTLRMVLGCFPASWGLSATIFFIFYIYTMGKKLKDQEDLVSDKK